MALVTISTGGASLSSLEPTNGNRLSGKQVGEAIPFAGACCRIASDGSIMLSIATADNANAIVHGFAMRKQNAVGGDLTLLMAGERMHYADKTLTPGQPFYLALTAGRLDTAPQIVGDLPVAFAIDDSRIQIVQGRFRTIA